MQYHIKLKEYWRILRKRKLTVVGTAIVLGALSTLFAALRAPTPLYSSSCSIRFQKEIAPENIYERVNAWAYQIDIDTVISLLKSYPVVKEVAQRVGKLTEGTTAEGSPLGDKAEGVVADLQSKVEVSRQNFANIIEIKVTDNSPVFARDFAKAIASTYKEFHARELNRRSTEAHRYIAEQLIEARQKLGESENDFNRFIRGNQLVSIELQCENQLSKAKKIRDEIRQLDMAGSELKELVVRLSQFIARPSSSDNDFYSVYADKQYQGFNYSLVELLLQRDSLHENLIPTHPRVVELQRRTVEVARKMAMIARLQMNNIVKRGRKFENELAEVDKKTNELMEKKLEYDRLEKKVDSYREMTALLERKNQEASIRKAERPDEVTIVKPALLPSKPINRPRTAATGAMGTIIGLILGMLMAFIIEKFGSSLGAIEDVEEILGVQVLGVIPHGELKSIKKGLKNNSAKERDACNFGQKLQLVSHFAPRTITGEAFRSLRTNILARHPDKEVKTVAITSGSPEEGKTTVAVNLAIAIAQAGMKTLLVECDLRKPGLADILGIEKTPGITDVLLGNYPVCEVVRTITDIIIGRMSIEEVLSSPGLDNLNIITSGTIPPNPGELIDSKRLEDFVEEVRGDYDLIIFDTSPILATADPVILGTKVDAVLLVYRVGRISRRVLKRSMVQLAQVKCHVAGVVLNDIKTDASQDFRNLEYYKYYCSYGREKKRDEQDKGDRNSQLYSNAAMHVQNTPSKIGEYDIVDPQIGEERAEKRAGAQRLMLLLIGLGFMIAGLLWQNGLLPIDTYFVKKRVRLSEGENVFSEKKPLQRIKVPQMTVASFEPEPAAVQQISNSELKRASITATEYPYSLRAGSFRRLEQVQKAVALLKKRGLDPYWCELDLGEGGKWFRVFVGYFSDSNNAKEFKERHSLNKGFISKTAYAVQIGEYLPDKNLDPQIAKLKTVDISPYFIEDPVRGYRLLTGAFVTHEAAEELAEKIRETGTDCKVVLR